MKSIKNLAFSAMLTLGAFSAITYTACSKDDCEDVVCSNGGTCVDGSCACPTGWEGTTCQTRSRDKFIGTWQGSDQCTSGNYNVTLTVATSSNEVNALVSNPGGFGNNITITGEVTASNKLTFTNQNVGGARTLSGTMTFNGNAMQFNYTVTPATGAADNCSGNYTKQ